MVNRDVSASGGRCVRTKNGQGFQLPRRAGPGHLALGRPVADDLKRKAGKRLSGIRQQLSLLSSLKTGDRAVTELAQTITWRELIHTSYFRETAVVGAIARHIVGGKPVRPARDPAEALSTPPHPFHALAVARAALALLVVGSLSLAAFSAFSAVIVPYTATYQLNQIAGFVAGPTGSQPELVNLPYDSTPGQLFSRLHALGQIKEWKPALQRIANENTRARSAQRLAYSLGHAGDSYELTVLLSDVDTATRSEEPRVQGAVALQGLIGALTGDHSVDKTFVDRMLGLVHNSGQIESFEPLLSEWLVPTLYARGSDERARQFADDPVDYAAGTCGREKRVAIKAAQLGFSDVTMAWAAKCHEKAKFLEILDLAISEAYDTKQVSSVASLVQRRMAIQPFSPAEIGVRTVSVLFDAARIPDAVNGAKMLLSR